MLGGEKLSKLLLRGQKNVSYMILQSSTVVSVSILRCGFLLDISRLPSVTKLRYNIETVLRSACIYGLSSHMTPISICFCAQFSKLIFSFAFLERRSRSKWAEEPVMYFRRSVLGEVEHSRALVRVVYLFRCQVGSAFALLAAPCCTQSILCNCFEIQITIRIFVKLSCALSALDTILYLNLLSESPICHLSVL